MRGPPPADADPERFEPSALDEFSPELVLARLPAGRHGLPRSFITRNQRLRVVAAMLQVLPRHGYAGTTIGHLTQEAGVSRAAFYRQFKDKEECYLVTYDLAGQWLCDRVERAVETREEWHARVRAGVSETLSLFAANPELAHLFAVEAVRAGPTACLRQQACLARFAEALRVGRPGGPEELPADLEDLLLGGTLAVIARYVSAGEVERLPGATPELVRCLLVPYLGAGETNRIVARAA